VRALWKMVTEDKKCKLRGREMANREIKFRLWCENKQEWESDDWHILPNGIIVESKSERKMNLKSHILEQFTGLLDCKGKEIYEGDIVEPKYNHISPFEVKFEEGKFNISGYAYKQCEVIGNIHEGDTNAKD